MREGSRDRNAVRVAVSGTSASAVAEGPLGRSKRGSWLLSGRKSYLDLLIDRLSDEGLSFGFGDVQAKFRYDLQYFVSDRRNELRLPSYARLDLRADRTFDWSRKRLTVFVEVINLLNRENVRFNPPRVTTSTRQVTRLFDSLVPIVPSAGILIEF